MHRCGEHEARFSFLPIKPPGVARVIFFFYEAGCFCEETSWNGVGTRASVSKHSEVYRKQTRRWKSGPHYGKSSPKYAEQRGCTEKKPAASGVSGGTRNGCRKRAVATQAGLIDRCELFWYSRATLRNVFATFSRTASGYGYQIFSSASSEANFI